MGSFFNTKNLSVSFKTFEGTKNVIDLEALSIQKGETFGLVGESGAGKSVLAYSILKLLSSPPAIISGDAVELDGDNLLAKNEREMMDVRGRKVSMIFQDPMSSLNPVFTIGDQLSNVLRKNRRLSGKALKQEVEAMLKLVQLPDPIQSARKYPHELSGGQRQRVIIALALSCDPQFLIADEPTRNLDVTIQAQILKLIVELQRKTNVTILYIANNSALVSSICDKMGVLHRGRLIEVGSVKNVMGNPLHPYTSILLHTGSKETDGTARESVGEVSMEDWSQLTGCRFVNQCPCIVEDCKLGLPTLKQVADDHYVACHYVTGRVG